MSQVERVPGGPIEEALFLSQDFSDLSHAEIAMALHGARAKKNLDSLAELAAAQYTESGFLVDSSSSTIAKVETASHPELYNIDLHSKDMTTELEAAITANTGRLEAVNEATSPGTPLIFLAQAGSSFVITRKDGYLADHPGMMVHFNRVQNDTTQGTNMHITSLASKDHVRAFHTTLLNATAISPEELQDLDGKPKPSHIETVILAGKETIFEFFVMLGRPLLYSGTDNVERAALEAQYQALRPAFSNEPKESPLARLPATLDAFAARHLTEKPSI